MNEEAYIKMKRARAAMLVDSPFFGSLAYNLQLKEDPMEHLPPEKRTMWTDGVTIGYCPEYVLKSDMPLLIFSIAHEAGGHCALGHMTRRNNRDHMEWNIACDYAVNALLKNAGFKLPSWCLYDPQYENKSAEEIFSIIQGKKKQEEDEKEEQKPDEQPEDKDQPDESKDEEDEKEEQKPDEQSPENAGDEPENGEGEKDGEGTEDGTEGESGDQGDDSGNGTKDGSGKGNETEGDCPGGCGEVRDFPGTGSGQATGEEMAAQEQQWKQVAAMAAKQAEQAGDCPGYIKQMVTELIESKVNWREVLQRFVNEHSKNDYSFRRPNMRYAGTGFILPGLFDEELPPIGFAIDTSGSTSEDLSQFASEAEEVLAQYNTTLQIVMADTEVRFNQEYTRDDIPLKLEMHGGGGTRFRDTFRYFNELDVPPLCVVYLTDLEVWGDELKNFGPEPEYPVLWIQTEGPHRTAPFGEIVRMKGRW